MKGNLQHWIRCVAAAAFACLCPVSHTSGQGSAREPSVELREAEVAVSALRDQVTQLQEALFLAESKVKALGEGLAASNAESLEFQESYRKIRLQLEALGVAVLDGSEDGLEQRLLQAVNDRRLLQEENSTLSEEVFHLSEVLLSYMESAVGVDPAAEEMAEKALERAEKSLRSSAAQADDPGLPQAESVAPLQNAKVVSVKADYGLIVFNVGKEDGVRIGMPFRVVRRDRLIGTVMVVDVRNKICGAVIQQLASEEPFAVGDTGRVAAGQDNF